jgi:glycerate 2-kinase
MQINGIRKIRNYDELLSHGDVEARKKVLWLMDAVLKEVDAGKRIQEIMRLKGDFLTVGEKRWDLSQKKRIYLLGAGKACNKMAQTVCEILGERITRGVISVKIEEPEDRYCNTDVYVGGHPLPNSAGMEAAREMLELIEQAKPDDLFISVISGGSSALLTYPVEGISLEEEIVAQDLLLKSGAKILEINAVRRHISRTNGGRLAEKICERGAELISLMVSDGVGMAPTVAERRGVPAKFFGTPVAPDGTTIQDARDTIRNYDLAAKMPKSIVNFLADDNKIKETPKQFGQNLTTFLLGTVPDSCEAAVQIASEKGLPALVLTTFLEGESREAGMFLSSIIREIKHRSRPVAPPCFVVCSGETTTTIRQPPIGKGGPSQELVLGLALGIQNLKGVAAASIDTEGTDGTTIFAGGIVDEESVSRFAEKNQNVHEALRLHFSGDALTKIGDNIFTGNTGTNLCDFNVLYIA